MTYNLSIDPGLQGTGWAAWERDKWTLPVCPVGAGVLTSRGAKSNDWTDRMDAIMVAYLDLLDMWEPKKVICEYPRFFTNDAGGTMAAAKGDIVKLSVIVGRLYEASVERGAKFIPVPVNDWKGQLPKKTIENRIAKRLGVDPKKYLSHSNDAVGVGLWAKGVL